jgi:hypothetical protein
MYEDKFGYVYPVCASGRPATGVPVTLTDGAGTVLAGAHTDVYRDTPRHEIHDINVSTCLRGDFSAAHPTGDHRHAEADRVRLRQGEGSHLDRVLRSETGPTSTIFATTCRDLAWQTTTKCFMPTTAPTA